MVSWSGAKTALRLSDRTVRIPYWGIHAFPSLARSTDLLKRDLILNRVGAGGSRCASVSLRSGSLCLLRWLERTRMTCQFEPGARLVLYQAAPGFAPSDVPQKLYSKVHARFKMAVSWDCPTRSRGACPALIACLLVRHSHSSNASQNRTISLREYCR